MAAPGCRREKPFIDPTKRLLNKSSRKDTGHEVILKQLNTKGTETTRRMDLTVEAALRSRAPCFLI